MALNLNSIQTSNFFRYKFLGFNHNVLYNIAILHYLRTANDDIKREKALYRGVFGTLVSAYMVWFIIAVWDPVPF